VARCEVRVIAFCFLTPFVTLLSFSSRARPLFSGSEALVPVLLFSIDGFECFLALDFSFFGKDVRALTLFDLSPPFEC